MNRQAKFAYAYMLIGLVLFLIGFVIVLNNNLNDEKGFNELTRSFRRVNFSELVLIATRTKTQTKDNPYEESEDEKIHLHWFCQLDHSHAYKTNEFETVISNGASKLISYGDSSSSSHGKKQTIHIKLIESYMLKRVFSFLICSTDKIYFIFIVSLCVFGGILALCGCIRFYKYDIKLLSNPSASLNEVDTPTLENKTSPTELAPSSETKIRADESCFYVLFKYFCGCCFCFGKRSSPTETKLKERSFHSNNSLNELAHLNNTNYKKSHSKFGNLTDKVGVEKSCPFIYDELPQFIINKNYNSKDSSLIAQPKQSTTDKKEMKYSFSNKNQGQFYALPQETKQNQQEQHTQTQEIEKPAPIHPVPPIPPTASPRNQLKDYTVFNEYTNFKRPPTLYSLYSNLPPDRFPTSMNESSFINTSNPSNMHLYENNLDKSSSFFVPIDDGELSKSKLNLCILRNKELNENIEKMIDKKIRSIMAKNNFINGSNNNSFGSQTNLVNTNTQTKCSKNVLFKQHSLADGSTQFKHEEHFL